MKRFLGMGALKLCAFLSVFASSFRPAFLKNGRFVDQPTFSCCAHQFETPVYIELTDCFNVMFYSNYPILMERGIEKLMGLNGESSTKRQVTKAKTIKFKRPARLGDSLKIEAKRLNNDAYSCAILKGDDELASMSKVECSEVRSMTATNADTELLTLMSDLHVYKSQYQIWPDELVHSFSEKTASSPNLSLGTRTIFNLFERARTDALGGPASLAENQEQQSHIYVGRISDYEVKGHKIAITDGNMTARIHSFTQCVPIGNTMANFVQQLAVQNSEGDWALIAKAVVTVVSVNASTGTPAPFSDKINKLFDQNPQLAQELTHKSN